MRHAGLHSLRWCFWFRFCAVKDGKEAAQVATGGLTTSSEQGSRVSKRSAVDPMSM
jgi:hypothetical protein